MEPEEKRRLGHEYFSDLKAKRKPMTHALGGMKWFQEISETLAKRVLADATKAGISDDQHAAMRKRMADWYLILKAYRKDEDEVRRDPKASAKDKDAILRTMRENLDKVRVSIFGE